MVPGEKENHCVCVPMGMANPTCVPTESATTVPVPGFKEGEGGAPAMGALLTTIEYASVAQVPLNLSVRAVTLIV